MKNVALPLLLAGSASNTAHAQDERGDRMAQDRATPEPQLIASVWRDGPCVSPAGTDLVAGAQTAVAGQETALQGLVDADAPLQEAIEAARAAKRVATEAVAAENTAVAPTLAADDLAQTTLLQGLLGRDQAALDLAAATAANALAQAAQVAAQAVSAEQAALAVSLTAAEAAAEAHHVREAASQDSAEAALLLAVAASGTAAAATALSQAAWSGSNVTGLAERAEEVVLAAAGATALAWKTRVDSAEDTLDGQVTAAAVSTTDWDAAKATMEGAGGVGQSDGSDGWL